MRTKLLKLSLSDKANKLINGWDENKVQIIDALKCLVSKL